MHAVSESSRPVPTGTPIADDLDLLLLIRRFENAALELVRDGLIGGTTHTCLGQEHVPVVVSPLLDDSDMVVSNHRGHGHYLARYRDLAGLLAEMTGRDGALCGGMGGSQHLYRPGFMSTGVQGEGVTVALGSALHFQRAGTRRIALAYIGDGTWGEGVVYESLNMARLWSLPLVVVVENNGIAQSTPTHRQLAGDIGARALAFGAEFLRVRGYDVTATRDRLRPLFARVRDGAGPLVVEFEVGRIGPHSKGDDTRSPADLAAAVALDWHEPSRRADEQRFATAAARADHEVRAVVADVLARPHLTDPTGGASR